MPELADALEDLGYPVPPVATPGGGGATSIPNRANLAALAAPADGTSLLVGEANKPGAFTFRTGSQTADITADPDRMLFVAPASAPSGSAGIWRRDHNNVFDAEWALNRGSDTPLETREKLQRAIRLVGRTKGATLLMPARDIDLDVGSGGDFGNINIDVTDITLKNRGGVYRRPGVVGNPANVSTFTVKRSNVRLEGFIFEGFRTTGGSSNGCCIDVLQGLSGHANLGSLENVTITDARFYGCDDPIRIAGSTSTTGIVVPKNILVEDILIEDCAYQAVAVWLSENVRFVRPVVRLKDQAATGREQFHLPFRLIGCHDTLIEGADVTGYKTQPIFAVMAGSGGQSPYNIHIRDAVCRRGAYMVYFSGARGPVHVKGGRMDNDPAIGQRTLLLGGYIIEQGWTGEDITSTDIAIEGVRGSGISHVANWNGPFKSMKIADTELSGSSFPVPANIQAGAVVIGDQGGVGFEKVEIYRNRWALQPREGEAVRIDNVVTNNSTLSAWDNQFPMPTGPYLNAGVPRRDVALKLAGTATGLRTYTSAKHGGYAGGNATAYVDDMGDNGFIGQTTGGTSGGTGGTGGETGGSTSAENWTNSQNTTMAALADGVVRVTKSGGSNGAVDGFAKTTAAFSGDFTLAVKLTQGISAEVLVGLNAAPSNEYLSIDRGIDFAAGGDPVLAFNTGYSIVANLPVPNNANIWWIFQRVGSSIKVYKNTAGPTPTGSALYEWTGDSAAYFGEVVLLASGSSADVKMS